MKKIIAIVVAACLTAGGASAVDYVEWNGTGDWPTSGNVQLAANLNLVVTDADVAAVEGWSNLYLRQGSRLTFANASVPATLKANVEGPGVLAAFDSVGLTISGNNSAKTGRCVFTNSAVMVAHEYGLGGAGSSAAQVYFTAAGTLGTLEFRKPEWDDPGWTGAKAFTNHCGIVYDCDNSYTQVAGKKMYVGSSAADEYFVQDGTFLAPYNRAKYDTKPLRFRNNYEQISGVFGVQDTYTSLHFYTRADAGSSVRFSGTTQIRVEAMGKNAAGWYADSGGNVDYYFGNSGGFHGSKLSVGMGTVHFETDDAFADMAGSTAVNPEFWIQPYVRDNTTQTNRWDLNGHDLAVTALRSANNTIDKATSKHVVFASATPATLTLGGSFPGKQRSEEHTV